MVHGIGSQKPGETLVQWGDALLRVIRLATRGHVGVAVYRASDASKGEGDSAEVQLRHDGNANVENWLLAEGWWADTFPTLSYRELVTWTARALPWSVSLHIAQRYWSTATTSNGAKFVAFLIALAQCALVLALTPAVVFLLVLVLLLGIVPQFRNALLAFQSALTASVGDSMAFVESPIRAALIRTRIIEGIKRLGEACENTIVVAHSQGAAAALDALGGFARSGASVGTERLPRTSLLTFGAGINKLASLEVLSEGMPKAMGFNPAYYVLGSIIAIETVLAWLYTQMRAGATRFGDIGVVTLALLATVALVSLLIWTSWRVIDNLAGRWNTPNGRVGWIKAWTLVILGIGASLGLLLWMRDSNLPVFAISFLLVVIVFFTGSMSSLLSDYMKKLVEAGVSRPACVRHWVDIYASADPVPNGETRVGRGRIESVGIYNRGSILNDHVTYWENLDGFVLQVVRSCARTARSSWINELPPETVSINERAKWRLYFLRAGRWCCYPLLAVLFGLLWARYADAITLSIEPASWLPVTASTLGRLVAATVLFALLAWVVSSVLFWIWGIWVRSEQKHVLNHDEPEDRPFLPVLFIMSVVGMVLSIILGIWRMDAQMVANPGDTISSLGAVGFGWGTILALLFYGLFRPPKWQDATPRRRAG